MDSPDNVAQLYHEIQEFQYGQYLAWLDKNGYEGTNEDLQKYLSDKLAEL